MTQSALCRLPASVIICTYTLERWAELASAVHSVEAQVMRAHQIIVVVDHNDDLLRRARLKWPHLTVLPNSGPRGLSGARNTGVGAATGDVVAFLDDDAIASLDWLSHLVAAYADSSVLGVGGTINPMWSVGRPQWFPEEFDWVVGCSYRGLPRESGPVRNLIGANMSMRHEVFDGVGGFRSSLGRDEKRPLGCEETELCIRAGHRWPERRFIHEPLAVVRHLVPAQRSSWRYFRDRCFCEGLSKAVVTESSGTHAGLSSERAYVLKTIPAGLARESKRMLRGPRSVGAARFGALLAGLAMTACGYVVGTISSSIAARNRTVAVNART